MNKYFKPLFKSALAVMAMAFLASCESETWKDHYSYKSDSSEPVSSLAKTIESMQDESAKYFVETLKSTYMYNGEKQLRFTYWDLLNGDQFFTVWLPSNVSQEDWDIYRSTDPDKDHKKIGTEFIMNHMARFSHSVGARTYERVKMMSEKSFRSLSDNMSGITYEKTNIRCTNGLIHKLNGYIEYSPTIYDYLTNSLVYKTAKGQTYDYKSKLGDWFGSYTIDKIDEDKSVAGEINEKGEIEYIDKVIIKTSELMKKFGYINVEDSDYIVVLPRPEVWDSVYDTIKTLFVYRSTDTGADSLQQYWTNASMLSDVFFNRNTQKHAADSVTSTLFSKIERYTETYPYHVYYRPFSAGGLFEDRIDSVICSNGVVYIKDNWPYSDSVFRRTVKVEAEDYVYSTQFSKTPTTQTFYKSHAQIGKNAKVIKLLPKDGNLEMMIPDNLKGKYLLKIVMFPNSDLNKMTMVHPVVCYSNVLPDGSVKVDTILEQKMKMGRRTVPKIDTIGKGIKSANYVIKPDTLIMGPFDIKECNYKNNASRLRLRMKNQVDENTDRALFDNEMWLDCLLLEPVL